MKHSFTVTEILDIPVSIAVGAYLDCEHYLHLHSKLSGSIKIIKHEGRKVTVKQSWKWFGITLGHYKTGEYLPPATFVITDVRPAPWWIPSIHHMIDIYTHLEYKKIIETNSTLMKFYVELDLPFWIYPFRKKLQKMIEKMHAQQNEEDLVCLKYRAKLFGRENNSAYLAPHQFLYHKDDYVAHYSDTKII